MTHRNRRFPALIAGAIISVLALAGCSAGGEKDSGASGDGDFPVTLASGAVGSGEEVTIGERPERIVSLSPTATESLFAIGAGDRVVAVDEYSYYPAEAPVVEGLSGYTPNVESVLSHDPDLVVASMDDGTLASGLRAAEVPLLVLPSAEGLADAYGQIERLGAATGNVADAVELTANMSRDIDDAVESVPEELRGGGLTYYHEVSSDHYTVADDTFLGQVYAMFGLSSIAEGQTGYPQLSAESIVAADPDFIFLSNGESESMTPEKVAERPGWGELTAVKENRIIVLDEDLASRWGSRLPQFVREIADALTANAPATATATAGAASR